MGGKASRDKGGRGEREAITVLQPIVDKVTEELGQPQFLLERNTKQRFAPKQYDLIGVPWVALEIKRHESLSGIEGWWRQVQEATNKNQTSVLMYRQNHQKWKFRIRVPVRVTDNVFVHMTVTTDTESFLCWFEQLLRAKLK